MAIEAEDLKSRDENSVSSTNSESNYLVLSTSKKNVTVTLQDKEYIDKLR